MANERLDLLPEHDVLIDSMYKEYVDEIHKLRRPDMPTIMRWLTYAYDTSPVPEVYIATSRRDALRVSNERTGNSDRYLDRWGPGDSGWIAWRDAGVRLGLLPADDPDVIGLLALRDFSRIAYDTVLLDDLAIVVPLPTELHVDDDGNLHSSNGPAVRWDDADQEFAWHGTFVPERMIRDPESYSAKDFLAMTNTEERRALGEIVGWSRICDLLGATISDSWTDPQTSLLYELLATSDRRFLRKQSPRLKGDGQPTYVEPVHSDLRSARGARRWQADPSATAAECDRRPELVYLHET